MTTLEKAAQALLDRAGYTEYGPVVPDGLAVELARAVLMAVTASVETDLDDPLSPCDPFSDVMWSILNEAA